jgi:DNA-binding transcriptional LysR family regulator
MEPADFRAFLMVAEELHFGRAAARLNITPPPLTRHIQRIERELGARLFVRAKRAVALTAAGAALKPEAQRLLAQLEALPGQVQRAAGGDLGTLRAGVISAALFSQARILQSALRKAMPAVHIAWQIESSADQVDALRQNRLDLGLIHTPIEHEGLALRLVMREPLVAALPATHPLAGRAAIPLRALRNDVFVVATRERVPSYYDRFIAACHDAGFEPKLEHQRQTIVNFLGLVAIGAGVTVVPASVSRVAVEGTRYVRLSGDAPHSELSVAWNPANRSPVLARALCLMPGTRRGAAA